MLSFLLIQLWIGIDDILLNFFATFGSVLELRLTWYEFFKFVEIV